MMMRINRAMMVVGLAAVGCDSRPTYRAPPVAQETATLKGENAVFVDGIDGQKVDGLQTYTNPPFGHIHGGNETVATAGKHSVEVAMYVGHNGGSGFSMATMDPQTQTVDVDLVPGHTYLFTTDVTSVRRRVRVHDLTAEAEAAATTQPTATADAK